MSGESEAAVTQAADMYTGSSDDGTESLEETQGGNIDETAGAQEDSERIETPPGLDTENRRIVVDDASFYRGWCSSAIIRRCTKDMKSRCMELLPG